MTIWFVLPETLAEMTAAARTVSAEKIEAYTGESTPALALSGSVAQIGVYGVLTEKPSYMARYYGGGNTTYPAIRAAIASAESDPRVKSIDLVIDSPGGELTGMFDTMDAIRAAKKPVKAIILSTGASAAYGIASQASAGIYAKSRAAMVGSVGVAYRAFVYDDEVNLSSTEAPKKRPDLKTEEGQAVVREELDALHALFAEGIAVGRGIASEKVNADFGRGAVLLADAAKSAGMIDGILTETKKDKGKTAMEITNVKDLKATYPALCEAVRLEGVTAERDRVTAHVTLGRASEALETAMEAIEKGEELTATLQAKYLTAGMNKQGRDARTADSATTAAQTTGVAVPEAETESEKVVAALCEKLGVEVK